MNLKNNPIIITMVAISMISAIFLVSSQNAAASNILSSVPNTLVAFWPADGNANDVTGHGHNGVLSGDVNFGNGITGGAFVFHGVKGSVNVGSLGINNTNAPFSISAWIKPNATILNDNNRHDIVSEGTGVNGYGNGQYFAFVSICNSGCLLSSTSIVYEIGSGQTFGTIKYIPITFGGGWTLVTVTYDGTKTPQGMKIYVNGTLQNAKTPTGSSLTGSSTPRDSWTIGAENPGPNLFYPFKGAIDDVKVFSCPLSGSEVRAQFQGHNLATCETAGTIQVGNNPAGIGVNPKTNKIYVANQKDNTVSVVDTTTNTVIKTITTGNRPLGVAVNPQTNKIYVTNFNSSSVSVIDGSTDTAVSTISVGNAPVGVDVNTVTNKIYVANFNDGTVSVINGSTNNVVDTIAVGPTNTSGVGVNSLTNKIYVTNANTNGHLPGTVSVINGSNDSVLSTIGIGNNPQFDIINPNTNMIYVTNQVSHTISKIDGSTDSVVSTIHVAAGFGEIGIDTLTNKIYYPTSTGTVQVLDGNSNVILNNISMGGSGYVGVNPSTNTVYVSNPSSNTITIINGL